MDPGPLALHETSIHHGSVMTEAAIMASSETAMISPPGWLREWTPSPRGYASVTLDDCQASCLIGMSNGPQATMISAQLVQASAISAERFQIAVREMLLAIQHRLAANTNGHPVRFWNFIPKIHESMGEGLDRYRVFNLGRHEAFDRWFGSPRVFERDLPTATGIGYRGDDLWIHALAMPSPGIPVENPRQVPAFRYSHVYGPKPPCFARATIVPFRGRDHLLIGGTASVRGEDSTHTGDVRAQCRETIENLLALVANAPKLDRYRLTEATSLRVYHVHPQDESLLRSLLRPAVGASTEIEFIRADICRDDLLVEIEAVVPASD